MAVDWGTVMVKLGLSGFDTSDHASVVSINIFVALICACIVIGHLLEENRWMNESITSLIIGLCTGIVLRLATRGNNSRVMVFSEDLFFIYVLPPIIFNAGYVLFCCDSLGIYVGQCSYASELKVSFLLFLRNTRTKTRSESKPYSITSMYRCFGEEEKERDEEGAAVVQKRKEEEEEAVEEEEVVEEKEGRGGETVGAYLGRRRHAVTMSIYIYVIGINHFFHMIDASVSRFSCRELFILDLNPGPGAVEIFRKMNIGALEIGDYLAIGAIFSATDSVCTLQVLNQDETPLLYSLVFGEGVVNDATSVVLFNAIQKFDLVHVDATVVLKFVANFFYLFSTSTLLGALGGLLSAYIIKKLYFGRHSTDREVALMILMAYLSYMLAELLDLSGILTVFFCGIVMSHYTWHNVTESSRITTKHAFATLSFIAEVFLFLYVGMDALDIEKWQFVSNSPGKSVGLSSILLGLVLIGRAAFVFPLSFISNLSKRSQNDKITFKQQVIIWWAGLMRGAVSIALAYNQFTRSGHTHQRGNAFMITSTITVVLFSTMIYIDRSHADGFHCWNGIHYLRWASAIRAGIDSMISSTSIWFPSVLSVLFSRVCSSYVLCGYHLMLFSCILFVFIISVMYSGLVKVTYIHPLQAFSMRLPSSTIKSFEGEGPNTPLYNSLQVNLIEGAMVGYTPGGMQLAQENKNGNFIVLWEKMNARGFS
ncbi:unnamed protein product [Musa textilis]